MLKLWVPLRFPLPLPLVPAPVSTLIYTKNASNKRGGAVVLGARRRVMYDEQDYQHNNIEIAMLESYTQSLQNELLLVTAVVDDAELQLLIFKGFSSCLTSKTPSDPSASVVPATAVIKSIDRIRAPFDPNSDTHYIEKGLTFHQFKTRLR